MDEILPYAVEALWLAAKISLLPLSAAMSVGLIVSVVQAATQIQEQTLSFVPKLISAALVLVATGAWITQWAVGFSVEVLNAAALITG